MTTALLEIRKLHKAFGKVVTANGIDLNLEKGVLTSIIGPNGAGKSTLINMLSGSLPVDSGEILFDGKDITQLPIHKRVRLGLCRSFQVVNVFPDLTCRENLQIAARLSHQTGYDNLREGRKTFPHPSFQA